jgi:hypothetical protein
MKKGIILVAKDPCVMNLSGEKTLTIGKKYKVIDVNDFFKEVCIIDDCRDRHWFDMTTLNEFFETPETDPFQEFFSFMHQTHGLILTNGEMWDILHEIEKLQEKLKA